MKEGSKDALESRGYSSTPLDDGEEWSKLRGLSEKEAGEARASTRHRKKNLAVLLLLVGLLGFLASEPLLLPDRLLGAIAINLRDTMESIFPDDAGPIIPPSAAQELAAQPVEKAKTGSRRAVRAAVTPSATPPGQPSPAVPAPQSPPFTGGVQVVQHDPTKPPFGVEIVDNRDRRYSPAPSERVISLSERGTSARVEVDPKVAERMRITPGPVISKEANVNGSVKLRAVISTEGAIKEMAVVSGPAELGPAAIQVARQWRYRPYYFNGRPVETETFITVNFNISTN